MTAPVRPSRMVDGRARVPQRPARTRSTWWPRADRTWRGVHAGGRLLMFALVDTRALPAIAHKAAAMGWAVTRTARVACRPRSQPGVSARAGSSQVFGPGQVASTACMRVASNGSTKGSSWSKSAAMRINPLCSGRRLTASRRCTAVRSQGSHPRP